MSRHNMRPLLHSLLAVSCLSLLLWTRPTAAGRAFTKESGVPAMPKQCRPGKTSTEALGWRWKPNTRVHVYFLKNNFNRAELDALSRAVNNWDKALKEIDARVSLSVGGEREGVTDADASLTVVRGIPQGKDRVGQVKFYSMSNGVMRALVIISPEITDTDALMSLMTHEIGHTLGLADCYECRRGTTTMSAFKDRNKGNEVFEPSECDKYVVALGYAGEVNMQARLAPAGR